MAETRVDTEVVEQNRQWLVYLLVITPDGVSRRLLQTYRTAAEAHRMADILRRSARRRRTEPWPQTDDQP